MADPREPGQVAWEAYTRALGEDRLGLTWENNGPGEKNRAAWAAVEQAIREQCAQVVSEWEDTHWTHRLIAKAIREHTNG